MKKMRNYLSVLLLWTAITTMSCSDEYQRYYSGDVIVLTVDYTTNTFLGGYTVPVVNGDGSFELVADYKAPSDFGDVAIYEKGSHTKLFAGDIVWMGKGERTHPKEISAPDRFELSNKTLTPPKLIQFDYTPQEYEPFQHDNKTLKAVWNTVADLDIVSQALENARGARVYMTLYARSVGVGDPADWYWLVFIRD